MVADLPLPELAGWCRRNSVTGIGLLRGTVRRLGAGKVAATLAEHGLEATSVCVALDLIGTDLAGQRAQFDDAIIGLQDAAQLGVPLVVVVGGPRPGLPLAPARRLAGEAVARLADRAAERGARVLIEPLHPSAVHLSAFTTLREAFACAASRPEIGVVLDIWHLWTDPELDASIERYGNRVDVVHVADQSAGPIVDEREIPGDGVIELVAMAQNLVAAGFAGWWELEVLSARLRGRYTAIELLEKSLAGLRRVLRAAGAGTALLLDGHEGTTTCES